MEYLKIILLSVVAAIVYGVIHDQVTARICIEYFTIGHPRILDTDSATLIALAWGVIATWWFGLILGIPLSLTARFGSRDKLTWHTVAPLVLFLLIRIAIFAVLGGIVGYFGATWGWFHLPPWLSDQIGGNDIEYIAVAWAHAVAYIMAGIEGVVLCCRTWKRRKDKK